MYASKSWAKHVQGDGESDGKVQLLTVRLLEDQGLQDSCLQAMLLLANRYDKFSWITLKRVPGLRLAATFNLHTIFKLMLQKGYLVDEENTEDSTALHAAAGSDC